MFKPTSSLGYQPKYTSPKGVIGIKKTLRVGKLLRKF